MFSRFEMGKQNDNSDYFCLVLTDPFGLEWWVYGFTVSYAKGFTCTCSPFYETRYANVMFTVTGENHLDCLVRIGLKITEWNCRYEDKS